MCVIVLATVLGLFPKQALPCWGSNHTHQWGGNFPDRPFSSRGFLSGSYRVPIGFLSGSTNGVVISRIGRFPPVGSHRVPIGFQSGSHQWGGNSADRTFSSADRTFSSRGFPSGSYRVPIGFLSSGVVRLPYRVPIGFLYGGVVRLGSHRVPGVVWLPFSVSFRISFWIFFWLSC